MNRREIVRNLVALAAGSPLLQAEVPDELMGPINVHEFEEVARRKMHKLAYDFIAGGVEDELTLRANRAAYEHVVLLPRVMTDVSNVSLETNLLGMKLASPILIAPTGGKNLVIQSADELVAAAALASKTLVCSSTGVQKLLAKGEPLLWWSNTIGAATKEQARG